MIFKDVILLYKKTQGISTAIRCKVKSSKRAGHTVFKYKMYSMKAVALGGKKTLGIYIKCIKNQLIWNKPFSLFSELQPDKELLTIRPTCLVSCTAWLMSCNTPLTLFSHSDRRRNPLQYSSMKAWPFPLFCLLPVHHAKSSGTVKLKLVT